MSESNSMFGDVCLLSSDFTNRELPLLLPIADQLTRDKILFRDLDDSSFRLSPFLSSPVLNISASVQNFNESRGGFSLWGGTYVTKRVSNNTRVINQDFDEFFFMGLPPPNS